MHPEYISLLRIGLCLPLCRNPNASSTNSTPWFPLILATPCASSPSKHDSIRKSTYNFISSTFSIYWITILFTQAQKRDPSSSAPISSLVDVDVEQSDPDPSLASTDHIPSPYDTHDCSRHPRSGFPNISAILCEMRNFWRFFGMKLGL
jgi:hypothetical protein